MGAEPTTSGGSYLDVYLAPFIGQLTRPDVTDLYVNRPGEIWVETLGGRIERIAAPEVTDAQLWRLARQVASLTHQAISREHPLLAARMPDGARIQIVAPPATREGIAIAVRKHVEAQLTLADYEDQGAFAQIATGESSAVDEELGRLHAENQWAPFLRAAIGGRRTIIISGGTSTGKTTFLNALLAEVDAAERIVLIEDTPEIMLRHENAVGFVATRGRMGEASVTTNELLTAALRMRPDRIILGELRGEEAFTYLRAINTGHPGSMTTIHADTPQGAIEQLVLLALQSGVELRRRDIIDYVNHVVDVIVQLERVSGQRRIATIRWTACPDATRHPV